MRIGLPWDRGQEGSPRRDVTATVALGNCATRASSAAVLKSPALQPMAWITACRRSAPGA
eukprot:15459365-Alexandrium_andersonii.AAC.1